MAGQVSKLMGIPYSHGESLMAKTLEKVSEEFNTLRDQLGEVEHQVDATYNNYVQLQALARQGAKEAGQGAARLRSKGHAGKGLDDFRNEAEVEELLTLWTKQQATAAQLEKAAKKAATDLPPLFQQLKAMAAELKAEIANREKKASRVIFKIKSESLPDLKKLLKEMEKFVTHCENNLVDRTKELPGDVSAKFDPTFEQLFDEEFKKAGPVRAQDDESDMAHGAKNVRVQLKYLREGRQMETEIKQLCAEAAKAKLKGDSSQPFLDSATKIYRQMHEVAKIQQNLLSTMRKDVTGDAKKVRDAAEAYVALSTQTLQLITKTTSATMGAGGSRKGKEKV